MMAFFPPEIPPTAVPPIPVLLPSPEEKKPPGKHIEGNMCSLPKCQKIEFNYRYCRPRKCCLMQHILPLVVNGGIAFQNVNYIN